MKIDVVPKGLDDGDNPRLKGRPRHSLKIEEKRPAEDGALGMTRAADSRHIGLEYPGNGPEEGPRTIPRTQAIPTVRSCYLDEIMLPQLFRSGRHLSGFGHDYDLFE